MSYLYVIHVPGGRLWYENISLEEGEQRQKRNANNSEGCILVRESEVLLPLAYGNPGHIATMTRAFVFLCDVLGTGLVREGC